MFGLDGEDFEDFGDFDILMVSHYTPGPRNETFRRQGAPSVHIKTSSIVFRLGRFPVPLTLYRCDAMMTGGSLVTAKKIIATHILHHRL